MNIGSAGCYRRVEIRLAILEIVNSKCIVTKMCVSYDDKGLIEAFEKEAFRWVGYLFPTPLLHDYSIFKKNIVTAKFIMCIV